MKIDIDIFGNIYYDKRNLTKYPEPYRYKYIDLFCGLGSFHLAWEQTNVAECVLACDIDEYVMKTYSHAYPKTPFIRDVYNLNESNLPAHDIICAGFPCQPFSTAGKKEHFNDSRGTLFFEIMRLARIHRTKVLMLENVQGLVSVDKGNVLNSILQELNSTGYDIFVKILSPHTHANIPQNRKRLFFICFAKELGIKSFPFPNPCPLTTTASSLLIPRDEVPSEYFLHEDTMVPSEVPFVKKTLPFVLYKGKYLGDPIRITKYDGMPCIVAGCRTSLRSVKMKIFMSYPDGQARLIIPLELQRFMGIPEDFPWPPDLAPGYKMRQIGNSICVPILNSLVHRVAAALDAVNKI